MISDRETRKMARFLPLLKKKEIKENTGTAEAVIQLPTLQNKNNLTQELRYSKIAKKVIDDRKKALEERRIK
jgi:hypothetical protein